MDIEEMMIDYIMNKATQERACRDNLSQMPDEEFDMFVKKFNIPHDGVKL